MTPEEKEIIEKAKQIAEANTDWDLWNGENFEKMFKDTQKSFTKARQQEIELAKLLVEQNPANIDKITNEVVKNKILNEKYGVENMEELKVMFPDYAKSQNDDDEDDATEIDKIKRELELIKYKNKKNRTKEALENIALMNKDVVSTIDDFEQKMKDELKFISESVEPSERMKKAFKLVVGSNGNSADAYSVMQWVTFAKTPKSDMDDEAIKKSQNEFRKLMGLKQK